jgi:hypothetical protein
VRGSGSGDRVRGGGCVLVRVGACRCYAGGGLDVGGEVSSRLTCSSYGNAYKLDEWELWVGITDAWSDLGMVVVADAW